ncbi:hypothetical protein ACTTAI_16345 [Rhodobacter capsulatus]|uniref:hypothetical protein n=1 Tax=Rhodobacter capsulatus TaxID=1061 RepID=UPI00402A2EB7
MSSVGVRIGHGTIVRIGRGSTPVWTTLSGCEDVTFPAQKRADEDVTSMDSPNETEESIGGLKAAADWKVTKHYVPDDAEDELLTDLVETREKVILEITPPGSTIPRKWLGYVQGWTPTMPVKGAMKGDLEMRIMAAVS